LVEKLVGDEVTGFYVPGVTGPGHADVAVEAARKILKETGHGSSSGPWVPVGVGVHTGMAWIGSVRSKEGMSDIAVLGDVANVASRLASQAGPGEILISEATRSAANVEKEGLEFRRLALKGRAEPVDAWILKN
jgi:adenylate cyclase